jgi:pyruvate dehydrogenase E2 component (dihydrolipoyllysine-residue acetyltransferase)
MTAAASLVEVRVPDMGNFKDVAIIDVLVKPGEKIEPEAPLVTLETEKATMDVPSTVGGVVEKIHITKGGTVSTGDLIVTVRSEGESASAGNEGGQGAGVGQPTGQANGQRTADAPANGGQAATGSASSAAANRSAAQGPTSGAGRSQASEAAQGSTSAAAQGSAPGGARGSAPGVTQGSASGAAGTSAPNAAPAGRASAPAGDLTARQNSNGQAVEAGGAFAGRPDLPPINEPGFSRAHAGPSVRKFARELGVDLTLVKGEGFKGRITHEDVKAFVKKVMAAPSGTPAGVKAPGAGGATSLPAVPVVDFAQFGEIETRPLSRIQKISGPRLHASWVNIPHVTQFDEADITDLEDARTKLKQRALEAGIKLTPLAFIVRACVRALQEFPLLNASLDPTGANLILKKYIHIGFAADTPNGLVVPVIRDANRKDIYEIAKQLGELSEKARAGKLSAAEMQGGSFTISSLGGIGGTAFTPIINAPEVAILGASRSAMKPVFRDGAFVPRLILPLSLSYDHRVIDGASAVRFTTFLAQTLADAHALTEAVP